MSLESDIEDPEKSPILSKNPLIMSNHHIRDFFCDTKRMAVSGVEPFDFDQVLEMDMYRIAMIVQYTPKTDHREDAQMPESGDKSAEPKLPSEMKHE